MSEGVRGWVDKATRGPTVLVDEYLTTKMHHRCQNRMAPVKAPKYNADGEEVHGQCGLMLCENCQRLVARDANASMNIAEVLHADNNRPVYLSRHQPKVNLPSKVIAAQPPQRNEPNCVYTPTRNQLKNQRKKAAKRQKRLEKAAKQAAYGQAQAAEDNTRKDRLLQVQEQRRQLRAAFQDRLDPHRHPNPLQAHRAQLRLAPLLPGEVPNPASYIMPLRQALTVLVRKAWQLEVDNADVVQLQSLLPLGRPGGKAPGWPPPLRPPGEEGRTRRLCTREARRSTGRTRRCSTEHQYHHQHPHPNHHDHHHYGQSPPNASARPRASSRKPFLAPPHKSEYGFSQKRVRVLHTHAWRLGDRRNAKC